MRKKLLNLCLTALACVISVAAYALDKNGEGVYQIGTAEDLKAFAELVNGGELHACAQLTADIDYGVEQTMIGTSSANRFDGTFDGQGHTIKYNFYAESSVSALFGYTGGAALIENLHVIGTIQTNFKYAAGMVGYHRGIIDNCISEVTITSGVSGDATHGGLVAISQQGAFITNTLVKSTITGTATQNCGGVVGWCDDRTNIQNCLVINNGEFDVTTGSNSFARNASGAMQVFNVDKYKKFRAAENPGDATSLQSGACYNNFATSLWGENAASGTIITEDDLKSGKICYLLNHDQSKATWKQTIGEDEYPLPGVFGEGHKQVYASVATNCHGVAESEDGTAVEVAYSNTDAGVAATAHTWDNGVCTTCGYFDNSYLERDPILCAYKMDDIEDYNWCDIKQQVSNGGWFSMVQMCDLTLTPPTGYPIFNTTNWFGGTYDGQGHDLTININITDRETSYVSLFPQLRGTVSNLNLHGTIKTIYNFAGSVLGDSRSGGYNTTTLNNVYSDVEVNTTKSGDATCGGIIGLTDSPAIFNNVIFAGKVVGADGTTNVGGICGWCSDRLYLNNVAMIGTIENCTDDTHSMSRNATAMVVKNAWCNPVHGAPNADNMPSYYEDGDVESGALAYALNNNVNGGTNFYQTIGTDACPYPFTVGGHQVVYVEPSDGYRCDGVAQGDFVYGNTPTEVNIPDHQYEEGICSECSDIDTTYMTPAEDGFYEISTPNQLRWWSKYAANYNLGAKGRLMADIDMEGIEDYAIIGKEDEPFYGSFDGQYHVVSNLIINYPGNMGVGFIGYMNSVPAGAEHKDADRNGTPAYIRNLTLDETCEVTAYAYVGGILGGTSAWQGNVEVSNCVVRCSVTAIGGANAGGIHGVCMGSTCAITVDNCGVTSVVTGPSENGVISGWMGSYGKLTNCWSISDVYIDGALSNNFVRATPTSSNNWWNYEQSGIVTHTFDRENAATGELTWGLNSSQFKEPVWYQRIGEDDIPYLDSERGVVAKLNGEYYSIYDESSLDEAIAAVKGQYEETVNDAKAYKAAREALGEQLGLLDGCAGYLDLANAMDTINVYAGVVNTSINVYKTYIDKCEEVLAYLAGHDDFEGEVRDALEAYLNDETEPDEENTLGSYPYIIENTEAPDSCITAETARVEAWLSEAITSGYMAGTDITNLVANPTFADSFNGWEGKVGTGAATYTTKADEPQTVSGGETWNTTMDMYQTVKGLKPGLYLMKMAGASRPANNRYSYNYTASMSLNGNTNYLMTVIEDYIKIEDAVSEVNCLPWSATADLRIYEDGITTSGPDSIGYCAHGPHGLAVAGTAGRYINYLAAEVGEDGNLKIGIKAPSFVGGASEWSGYSDIHITYLGTADEADAAQVDLALQSQLARVNTILTKYVEADGVDAAITSAPNYPASLKAEIVAAQTEAQNAATVEEKMACISKISDLFNRLFEAKTAYIAYYNTATSIETLAEALVSELTEDEYNSVCTSAEEMLDAYFAGTASVEEALNPACLSVEPLASTMPKIDSTGVYHLTTPRNMQAFSAFVAGGKNTISAVLDNDIDMAGKAFMPVGVAYEGASGVQYKGTFDGQEHALTNITIGDVDAPYSAQDAAPFYYITNGTVKNLKVQAVCSTSNKYAAGIAAHTSAATIDNCDVDVVINSTVEGDGTHGGIIGVNEGDGTKVSNCYVHVTFNGETTNSCGGMVGWASGTITLNNSLVIADTISLSLSGCNSISRYPDNVTCNNMYYTMALGDTGKGTQTTFTKLASGEIAWALNGSTAEDAHWFQTLGTDTIPHLYAGDKVWKSAGKYQNDEPVIELNAYAYNVEAETDEENVYVYYTLNAPAAAVAVEFYNGENLVLSVPADGLEKGEHAVKVANSELGESGASLTYKVKVTGIGTADFTKVGDSYKFLSAYGLTVNNNPASANFGQLLVTEARPTLSHEGMHSEKKPGALFAFDTDFQPVNSVDGTPGFYGGLDIQGETPLIISSSYQFDLRDIEFSNDGRLFVTRAAGVSPSSIYEINPENLNEPWTPVFAGGDLDEETGITYVDGVEQNRMAISMALEGEGENLKMYILGGARSNGEFNTSDFICSVYNLGTAKTWSGAPSADFAPLNGVYTIASSHVGIKCDGNGGLWYVQYRDTPSATLPAIKHYNAEGVEDYSDITTATKGGKMAISRDGLIAMPVGSNKIAFYQTDYAPNAVGKIFLTARGTATTTEDQFTGMAFDYAGNLYVVSSGTKTLSRYTVPRDSKVTVTPSAQTITLGEATAISGVEASKSEGAIYNISGQRVSKAQNGVFIQNGKKVAVK